MEKLNVRWYKSAHGSVWFLQCKDCGRACGQLRRGGCGNERGTYWWVCVGRDMKVSEKPYSTIKLEQAEAVAALKRLIKIKREAKHIKQTKLQMVIDAKTLLSETLWQCGFCHSEIGGDCSKSNPCDGCLLQRRILKFLKDNK